MKNNYSLLFCIFLQTIIYNCLALNQVHKAKLDIFAQVAYSTRETIYNTFVLATECINNNIEGDFVECGVAAGAQIAAMAYAAQTLKELNKKIHLFDSFEGIPLAGPNDDEQPGVGKIEHSTTVNNLNDLLISSNSVYPKLGRASAFSVEQVENHMKNWKINRAQLIYHKGWFQYTLPKNADNIKKISLLRLDGDLYESTKICLEFLYPKINKGGYIIIDDYGTLSGCRKAVTEYLEKNNIKPNIISVPGGLGPVYWQIQ